MKNIGERYLEVVGIKRHQDDIFFINQLVLNHLESFSFNNIEVYENKGRKILSLDVESLFQKIVVEKRGGYCFEQNKLMYQILKDLGFDVSSKLGRVVYNRDEDVPRTHRMTIVKIAKENYLVDVGFGAYAPNCIVPLDGEKVDVLGEDYYIEKDCKDNYKLMANRKEIGPFNYYVFDLHNYQESDFNLGNYYTNTHPESKFVQQLIISKKNKERIIFIAEGKLVTLREGSREEVVISSSEDLKNILQEHFGLSLIFSS